MNSIRGLLIPVISEISPRQLSELKAATTNFFASPLFIVFCFSSIPSLIELTEIHTRILPTPILFWSFVDVETSLTGIRTGWTDHEKGGEYGNAIGTRGMLSSPKIATSSSRAALVRHSAYPEATIFLILNPASFSIFVMQLAYTFRT